jgi:drug/metabolite transporter (DMT)-like permease
MEKAILLAAAACCCTAASSVCPRMEAKSIPAPGFAIGLVFRLARPPVWLLGIACMIAGFVFQLAALRFGALALVQPILAAELVLVFGYLAVAGSGRVKRRDWLAAAAMSAGIGVFLRVASPSGGRLHAPGSAWLVAGLATLGVVLLALAVAFGLGRRPGASGTRRAAVLGAATGISWGFMAAVIKELSSHLDNGIGAIFSSWSLYLLMVAGAALSHRGHTVGQNSRLSDLVTPTPDRMRPPVSLRAGQEPVELGQAMLPRGRTLDSEMGGRAWIIVV